MLRPSAQVTDSDLDGNEFVKTNAWVEGQMVTTAIKRNPPSKPPYITRRWIDEQRGVLLQVSHAASRERVAAAKGRAERCTHLTAAEASPQPHSARPPGERAQWREDDAHLREEATTMTLLRHEGAQGRARCLCGCSMPKAGAATHHAVPHKLANKQR